VTQIIAIAGLVPGLIVAAYKGVLFSTTAQPGSRTMRWLGATFALSAMSMGAAVLLAIASRAGDLSAARILRFILMWLLVLCALVVRRILGRVHMAGHLTDLGSDTTALRVALHYAVFIVAGLGLPIVPCALSKGAPAVDAPIVLIVLAGALVSRHYLVMLPHHASAEPTKSNSLTNPELAGWSLQAPGLTRSSPGGVAFHGSRFWCHGAKHARESSAPWGTHEMLQQ
jgi:hypothetical protein